MLEMRPDCERCGTELPADEAGAFICSFECTYLRALCRGDGRSLPQLRRRADGPAGAGGRCAAALSRFHRAEVQRLGESSQKLPSAAASCIIAGSRFSGRRRAASRPISRAGHHARRPCR